MKLSHTLLAAVMLAQILICIKISQLAENLSLTVDVISHEVKIRDKQHSGLEDRIIKLESHFNGHTVVLAKDGRGISVIPCKLNIDKDCYRDDTGITLDHLNIIGNYIGLESHVTPLQPNKATE